MQLNFHANVQLHAEFYVVSLQVLPVLALIANL